MSALTRGRYRKAFESVVAFLRRTPRDAAEWDAGLTDFIETLFYRGDHISVARYALYGCAFVLDWARRSPQCMPLAKASLKGFAKVSPQTSRDPPCLEMCWLLTKWLLRKPLVRARVLSAAFVWLAFDSYLRPSEALDLVGSTVGRPRRGAVSQRWFLTIAPTGGKPAKNNTFDAGVVCGAYGRDWIEHLLRALCQKLDGPDPLLRDLSLPILEKVFDEASQDLGFKIVPHGLRHAGPSHDAMVHKASMVDLQCRGRWLSMESCRIYTKPAAVLRSTALLSEQQLHEAARFSKTLPQLTIGAVQSVL